MIMWITLEGCGGIGMEGKCGSGDCLQDHFTCEGGDVRVTFLIG